MKKVICILMTIVTMILLGTTAMAVTLDEFSSKEDFIMSTKPNYTIIMTMDELARLHEQDEEYQNAYMRKKLYLQENEFAMYMIVENEERHIYGFVVFDKSEEELPVGSRTIKRILYLEVV